MKEVEFQMNYEVMQALFQGKRVELVKYFALGQNGKALKIIIRPPYDGIFISLEKFKELERAAAYGQSSAECENGNLTAFNQQFSRKE